MSMLNYYGNAAAKLLRKMMDNPEPSDKSVFDAMVLSAEIQANNAQVEARKRAQLQRKAARNAR